MLVFSNGINVTKTGISTATPGKKKKAIDQTDQGDSIQDSVGNERY